jgi:ligand-binding sensor domain-containing protein
LRSLSICRRRLLELLATILVGQVAFALDPNRALSQYIHDRWGPDDGFPKGPVYAIAQTEDGYLWIGTESGLVRFDGVNFRIIKDQSGQARSVLGLTSDNEGNLWVRLYGPTLLRYRGGAFADAMATMSMPYSNVTVICRASDGRLLVGRLEEGIVTHSNGKFQVNGAASPRARTPLISLAQTPDGDLWMGTRDAGLFRVKGNQLSAITGLPDTKVNCLQPDGERNLWIGTDSGIALWNGSELTSGGLPPTLNRVQALAIVRDRDANIWVGTDARGVLRINAKGVSHLESLGGSSDAVTALFEDREGSLWIGSASGLERIRDSAFMTYSLPEGVPSDGSNPVFIDDEYRVWIPPADGGLWWLKDGHPHRVTLQGLDKDIVYSLAGRRGELWIGRQRGGLTHLRSENGAFTSRTYTRADGLPQDSVYSIHQSRDGSVWAGTLSGGVSELKNGKFTTYTAANGLASNTVASIAEDTAGAMWFATPTGLSAFSNGRW